MLHTGATGTTFTARLHGTSYMHMLLHNLQWPLQHCKSAVNVQPCLGFVCRCSVLHGRPGQQLWLLYYLQELYVQFRSE